MLSFLPLPTFSPAPFKKYSFPTKFSKKFFTHIEEVFQNSNIKPIVLIFTVYERNMRGVVSYLLRLDTILYIPYLHTLCYKIKKTVDTLQVYG